MKKILLIAAVAISVSACKNKSAESREMVPLADPYNVANDRAKPPVDTVVTTTTVTVTKTPVNAQTKEDAPVKAQPVRSSTTKSSTRNDSYTPTGPVSTASAPAPVENKKKGWSKAAKGTAIGAGAGAATGAIITRDAKGAIIGGVVGAAGGYIIGRKQDKKDGRVTKD